ncbi:hypothetical protein baBA2_000931 (plasmid) [Borrelia anserina]|uniref:Uncharacterized protein n=1 Tax=Borrelia anserina Es TaxID=1365188 RepID=A0ABM6FVD2_BORAN|nr:hypothetical protein [Borrelia anserina]APR65337.1 hypothetical protein N187_A18 [Borrelia anserina Es]UPA07305.1 hypothetical protein baBA2_000931 [Borrelia anserina]
MNKNNPAFDELKKVLLGFKQELENKRAAFLSTKEQINVHLEGVLNEIFYPSDLEEVYKALGYDGEVIRSLGEIIEKVSFPTIGIRSTRVVVNLLNSFKHVAHSIETLFEDVFNNSKLEMLKSREEDVLVIITANLVEFIDMVKSLTPEVRNGIISAASETSEDDVIRTLQISILNSRDVRLRTFLRNLHDSLFDIINLVDLEMVVV